MNQRRKVVVIMTLSARERSSTLPARPPANRSVAELRDRIAPAGAKVAAAELGRLVFAYGIPAERWKRIAVEWVDAVKHCPADLLDNAISQLIRKARTGDYFPRPGDILELINDELLARNAELDAVRSKEETWPRWLAELWGPEPEGPRRRAEAMAGKHEGTDDGEGR